jgi:hypothetical protein
MARNKHSDEEVKKPRKARHTTQTIPYDSMGVARAFLGMIWPVHQQALENEAIRLQAPNHLLHGRLPKA